MLAQIDPHLDKLLHIAEADCTWRAIHWVHLRWQVGGGRHACIAAEGDLGVRPVTPVSLRLLCLSPASGCLRVRRRAPVDPGVGGRCARRPAVCRVVHAAVRLVHVCGGRLL
jgi:hypothetical protein